MISAATIRSLVVGILIALGSITAVTAASAEDWQHLTPRQRYDRMQRYRQYESLPPERRDDLDKRYERWRKLPDAKRKEVLRNYRRYQKMPPSERRNFDRKYDRWRQEYRPKRQRRDAPMGNGERNADRPGKKNRKQR